MNLALQLGKVRGLYDTGISDPRHELGLRRLEGRVQDDGRTAHLVHDLRHHVPSPHTPEVYVHHNEIRLGLIEFFQRVFGAGRDNDLVSLRLQFVQVQEPQMLMMIQNENLQQVSRLPLKQKQWYPP